MKNLTECIEDLIEEAKLRTVWGILCIFAVTYFLTHTSKSMLMNVPIAVLFVSGVRILLNEVDVRWKVRNARQTSYLSHLEKKHVVMNDSLQTTPPSSQKWKEQIGSSVVEAAIEDFITKVLQDFVVDLWYSDLTPDKDAPELIRALIMDVLGEVSERLKEVNLVELLTRDVVDLIGDHFDLFRKNHVAIGRDVMKTLSSEERDVSLKYHLLASKELHPALISPESEYKFLQRLIDGLLAIVLTPREAQCPLVRCFAREIVTCLILQPVMDFASPEYVNEVLEYIITAYNNDCFKDFFTDHSPNVEVPNCDHKVPEQRCQSNGFDSRKSTSPGNQGTDLPSSRSEQKREVELCASENVSSPRPGDWAKMFDAATQRRTEVLTPENLENMWTIGRNYRKRPPKGRAPEFQASQTTDIVSLLSLDKDLENTGSPPQSDIMTEAPVAKLDPSFTKEDKSSIILSQRPQQDTLPDDLTKDALSRIEDPKGGSTVYELEHTSSVVSNNSDNFKISSSASDLEVQLKLESIFDSEVTAPIINEYYNAQGDNFNENSRKNSEMDSRTDGLLTPRLRCRVIGAYFEKLGSNSFAVYLIAVTDADKNTWFVKRRYRNFERLHRNLKDIPNYTLHLPPKRIFSSSIEDAFVHQRCIQLDKYLQDLFAIANVAEQHEVWDFVSTSSENYSFGKSSSAMKTLAVNVDDAVDDIVRQFKEVSDGLMRVVVGPSSPCYNPASSLARTKSWNVDDINKLAMRQSSSELINCVLNHEKDDKNANHWSADVVSAVQTNGRQSSENELLSKVLPPGIAKHGENVSSREKSEYPEPTLALLSVPHGDPEGVPPEWTPPNVTVPILNLVDNIFQLNRRGWLRRQVFWISKQILQLLMEDAIDELFLSQIQLVRQEHFIAQAIRWLQNILWPGGVFFRRLKIQDQLSNLQGNLGSQPTPKHPSGHRATQPGSFEQQLEAARRASDVKKILFNGAPTALVSFVGPKQYRRCARDIYFFIQSTVCLKQLGYGILELVLISIFPELGDVVKDIHEKMHTQPT